MIDRERAKLNLDIIKKYETKLHIEDIYPKICKPIKDEVEFV